MIDRILVCGSRTWEAEGLIRSVLMAYVPPDDVSHTPTVMHGDNGRYDQRRKVWVGADKVAKWHAEDLGFVVEDYPADWSRGRRAGPERNRQMLDLNPDVVLAFKRGEVSRGTDDTINEARRRGIEVIVHRHPW